MNIVEGNKLIAEFMGFEKSHIRNSKGESYDYDLPEGFDLIKETETTIEGNWCDILMEQDSCMVSDLKFHKAWNWLMRVVEKIYDVAISGSVTYNSPYAYMSDKVDDLKHSLLSGKIDRAYPDVIKIIQLCNKYNKNK